MLLQNLLQKGNMEIASLFVKFNTPFSLFFNINFQDNYANGYCPPF